MNVIAVKYKIIFGEKKKRKIIITLKKMSLLLIFTLSGVALDTLYSHLFF